MKAELDQVAHFLDQASWSLAAGQVQQACGYLAQAGNVLETISAAAPTTVDLTPPHEPLKAFAAAA